MKKMKMNSTLPSYFLSHGGGPWPWMKDQMPGVFDVLEASLKQLPLHLAIKPKAYAQVRFADASPLAHTRKPFVWPPDF